MKAKAGSQDEWQVDSTVWFGLLSTYLLEWTTPRTSRELGLRVSNKRIILQRFGTAFHEHILHNTNPHAGGISWLKE